MNERILIALCALLFTLSPLPLLAGGGDDHTHGPEQAMPASIAKPATGVQRWEIRSPEVELLGILQDGKLTLYADRFDSNEPILGAKIELSIRSP